MYCSRFVAFVALFALALAGCGSQTTGSSSGPITVNLGYFPNLTHTVALVGVERGTFQNALGPNVKLATKTFNAGPALIEALFAGDIDIGYVGPSPAIAGAASGGALFIVRPGANIQTAKDLANKKLADPQFGGTQDVSLRYFLHQNGLQSVDKGGNVKILPTDNPTILTLFKEGKIDGAWVPEPWATRLVVEGNGKVFVDERTLWPNGKFVTTNVVVRTAFLNQHPDLVRKFLQAHVDTIQYILSNPGSAKSIANSEIKGITGKALPSGEIAMAYNNLDITYDPLSSTLQESANRAFALGFLGTSNPNLNGIYYLGPLNQVLASKGLASIAGP
jgi:NitT/TauT family transport system substrate-binding protein